MPVVTDRSFSEKELEKRDALLNGTEKLPMLGAAQNALHFFLDVKQSDAPGKGDTKRAQFLSSFGARHTKVNDQRRKVAMALARPMPPNTLKDQGNRQCADRCTKCPPFLTLTSCLPAERHAEESEQLTEEIRRLPACTAVQSDERFLWILVS